MRKSDKKYREEYLQFVVRHYRPGQFDSRKAWSQLKERLSIVLPENTNEAEESGQQFVFSKAAKEQQTSHQTFVLPKSTKGQQEQRRRFTLPKSTKEQQEPSAMRKQLPNRPKQQSLRVLWRIAAVVVPAIVASILFFTADNPGKEFVADTDHTQLTLPDQTRVDLRQGALLAYDKTFDKTERRVSMQGEITFSVTRDEEKPFIVSTPSAQIEVLGTEFNVVADEEESRLFVLSGTVRFTPSDPAIPLLCSAGMKVHYDSGEKTVRIESPDSRMEVNGKSGTLTFENAKLKEILRVLTLYYNVPVDLPENEAELLFSSSFSQKSIIEIINIINLTLDTHINLPGLSK